MSDAIRNRRSVAVVLVVVGLVAGVFVRHGLTQSSWTTKAAMPSARYTHAAATLQGQIHIVGGADQSNCSALTAHDVYNPATDTWSSKAPMQVRRAHPAAAVLNDGNKDLLYVVGGATDCGVKTDTMEAYDPATNTWASKASMPGGVRNSMGAAVINNRLYVVGGIQFDNAAGVTTLAEMYNPVTDSWTAIAPMPHQRYAMAIGVINDILYVAGGGNDIPNFIAVDAYDPATNSWSSKAPLSTVRAYVASAVVNNLLYAIGGQNGVNLNSVEIYDPSTDTWSAGPALPAPRSIMPAAVVANRIYVSGGGYTNTSGLYGDTLVLGDGIAPVTTATPSLPPNGNGWNNGDVTLNLSAVDNAGGSGVATIAYALTGAQSGAATVNTSSTSFTITNEGTTTVTYHAIDAAGNVESDKTLVVKIDRTPPSVTPPNNMTVNANAGGTVVTFSPSSSDLLSGIASVQSSPYSSGQVFPVGTTQMMVTAYDFAGNAAMTSFTVTVVPSRPVVTVTGGSFLADGNAHPATVSVRDVDGHPVSGSVNVVYSPGGAIAPSAAGRYGADASFTSSDPGILSVTPWATMAPDPNAKNTPAVTEINGKLYVFGWDSDAIGNQSSFVPRLSIYDPSANSWSIGASPSQVRAFVFAAASGGKLYVAGGCVLSDCAFATNTFEIYDVATNQWSIGPSMPTPRFGGAAGILNGKLYVVGGAQCSQCDPVSTTEIYDPATNQWSAGTPIPVTHVLPGSTVANGLLYVIGGYDRNAPAGDPNFVAETGTVEVYNPFANTWTERAPMPTTRFSSAVGAANGIIYVAGGNHDGPSGAIESYDPANDAWTAHTPMLTPRYYVSGGVVGTRFYVIDGSTGVISNTNEAFDTSLAASIAISGPTSPTAAFTATPNPSACGQAVQFDASASAATTAGRQIASYHWDFGDGSSSNLQFDSHAYGAFGTYTATLTVTDNNTPALSGVVSHSVTVSQGNQPPQPNAGGPYSVNAGGSVQLNGSGSDPNAACGDSIASYHWTIDGAITLTGQIVTVNTSAMNLGAGSHSVSLQVFDTFGASSTVQTSLTVQKTLVSVEVSPASASVTPGQNRTFQAIGHFSDGSTQQLQSGSGGGGGGVVTGPSNPSWSVQMTPPIDVSACATAQYPGPLVFVSQGISDQGGVVHTNWSPGTPVVNVDGTINASAVSLTLACTTNAVTGTINATWNGTRYAGAYSFNGGASTGTVAILGWSQQAAMPAARFSHAAASVNGAVYVFGGGDPSQPSPVLKYAPGSNSWTTLGAMPTSREGLGAATINGLVYVVGGHVAGGIASGVLEAYDASTDSWITGLAPMPTPRAHLAAVTDGTYLYALGGDTIGSNGGLVATVERYDPSTNSWLARAPMPSAGNFVVAGALNNTIVVAGINSSNHTDVYDIAANAWHSGATMPAARNLGAAGVANGGMYVVGGTVNGSPMYPSWVYYPATNQTPDYWSGPGSIPTARVQLAAAVVGDVVYALGGFVPGSNPATVLASNEALSTPPAYTFSPLSNSGGNAVPTVQWQSSNPSVATVDSNGNAHASGVGQISVIAVASNGISCASTSTCGTLSVTDSVGPNLSLPPNRIVEANNGGGANNVSFFASSFDGVDGARRVDCTWTGGSASFFPPSFQSVTRFFPFGTTTVSCSASDNSANTSSGSFTITVRDTNAPFVNVPSQPFMTRATSAAGAIVNFGGAVSAFDSVDGPVTPSCAPASGSLFPIGSTQVTCTATDAHQNTSAPKTFTVTVNDRLTIHLPGNIVAEATSAAGAAVPFSVSATYFLGGTEPVQCFIITGFVGGNPQIGPSVVPGATFPLGTTTVGCLANYPGGGHEGGFFTITVEDTTAPQITTPVNLSVNPTSPAGASVTFSVSAADLVDGAVAVACVPASGAAFVIGTTTVNCSATDAHSNTRTASFTVTVLSAQQLLANAAALTASINYDQGTSLLQNAIASLNAGQIATACNQLGAYINQIQAQTGKTISAADAAALTRMLNAARAAMGC